MSVKGTLLVINRTLFLPNRTFFLPNFIRPKLPNVFGKCFKFLLKVRFGFWRTRSGFGRSLYTVTGEGAPSPLANINSNYLAQSRKDKRNQKNRQNHFSKKTRSIWHVRDINNIMLGNTVQLGPEGFSFWWPSILLPTLKQFAKKCPQISRDTENRE